MQINKEEEEKKAKKLNDSTIGPHKWSDVWNHVKADDYKLTWEDWKELSPGDKQLVEAKRELQKDQYLLAELRKNQTVSQQLIRSESGIPDEEELEWKPLTPVELEPERKQSLDECAYAVAKAAERLQKKENEGDYANMLRSTGSGPIRINTPLCIRDDLYSKLFVSSFHAEYIHKYKTKVEYDASIKVQACKDAKVTKEIGDIFALGMAGIAEDKQESDYDPTEEIEDSDCEKEFDNVNTKEDDELEDFDEEQAIKDDRENLKELRGQLRQDRRSYASRMVAVWIFQVAFSMLILVEAVKNEQLNWTTIPDLKIGFTRFIAMMVMHVIVTEEILNGLKMMKYAANHWWKFSNPRIAWLSGLMQMTAVVWVAIVNYFVITISEDVLTLAKDFTALLFIADFDDLMSSAISTYAKIGEISDDIVENKDGAYDDLLMIEVTTSSEAGKAGRNAKLRADPEFEAINRRRTTHLQQQVTQRDLLTRPKTIHLTWKDRTCFSRIEYYIYLFFRKVYVAVWFYFLPFIVLLLMYFLPVINNEYGTLDCSGEKCELAPENDFT